MGIYGNKYIYTIWVYVHIVIVYTDIEYCVIHQNLIKVHSKCEH